MVLSDKISSLLIKHATQRNEKMPFNDVYCLI